jgi:hypothetical protein
MFTPKVFNWDYPYDFQICTELLKANTNFEIVANAFVDSDIENQPIKRAVYIDTQPPSNPTEGMLWFNTNIANSELAYTLNLYVNNSWVCLLKIRYDALSNNCQRS